MILYFPVIVLIATCVIQKKNYFHYCEPVPTRIYNFIHDSAVTK